MKNKLIFDTTDGNTIADSDNMGAYLRASDGTLLTHTDVSGKKALDVNIPAGISVDVDLSHTTDSIRLGDGSAFFTSTSENSDVALDVHISNSSIAVTAADLDIRDLAFATDKVDVSGSTVAATQSGVWDIGTVTTLTGITNDVNIADGGNSITVDAVDLDIRDLAFATDSVDVSGSSVTVNDAALAASSIASGATSLAVADTAQDIIAAPLASRKYVFLANNDNRTMYIGESGVSAADGFPVAPGSTIEMRAGASVDIEFVSAKAAHDLRFMELS